jgi:hypothetical protein
MPLTRHLYEMDEVVAALQLCLRGYHGYTTRALFWTWELVVSDEPGTAESTIKNTWLAYGGGIDPTLIALKPTEPKHWVSLVLRANEAIHRARDMTVARFMTATAGQGEKPASAPLMPNTPPPRSPPAAFLTAMAGEALELSDGISWWMTLDRAVRTSRCTEAFWLLQAAQPTLSADTVWFALQTMGSPDLQPIIPQLQANIDAFDPVQQAAAQGTAILLLCASPVERALMLHPVDPPSDYGYRKDWATWTDTVGRRAARKYPIPPEALHAGTTRGALEYKYTNIMEVYDPIPALGEACMFWRKALLLYGIEVDEEDNAIAFPDDDVLERFYAAYFPDDIPDEWSKADQEKSHGRGVQKPAAHPAPPPQIREEPLDYDAWVAGLSLTA